MTVQLHPHRRRFQSTLPREERLLRHELIHAFFYISIHAPTRGATDTSVMRGILYDFNPRSHERSDDPQAEAHGSIENFNPRSHERSDKQR